MGGVGTITTLGRRGGNEFGFEAFCGIVGGLQMLGNLGG